VHNSENQPQRAPAAPAILPSVPDPCPICNDLGLRAIERDGIRYMEPCDCRLQRRASRRLEQARIPRRYEHCSLDNYETKFASANRSLSAALLQARKFVESYPLETDDKGLLITGTIGVGKTHLAVGILKALVTERGASG
jgi:DNA replication protein DnaC